MENKLETIIMIYIGSIEYIEGLFWVRLRQSSG